MSKHVDLACTVCTEEFVVPMDVYKSHSDVVLCPCCGSTDLLPLGVAWSGPAGRSTPAPEVALRY
jgi:hypothetical protein